MRDATQRTGLRFWRLARGRRHWAVAAALASLLALWQQPVEAQIHPFYREASEAGAAAYGRGDFTAAAERFRIASFGMLDEPRRLAETLTRLGLAQAAAGQRDEFSATFDRISRIEELFNAYSTSPMPAALRSQFEEQVSQWVPRSTLEQSTVFAKLYRRQELSRLQKLLPAARTAALEQIVATHPGDAGWQLMLATARIQSGSGADAIAALEGMVADRPDSQKVACLLGRAYLQSRSCEPVLQAPVETVHRCDIRRLPTTELVQYLECFSAAERWLEAASLVISLAPERSKTRPFPNWEKRIARRIEPEVEVQMLPPYAAEKGVAEKGFFVTEPVTVAQTAAASPSDDSAQPAASTLRELPLRELAILRRRLAEAFTVTDLQTVMVEAEELSRRNPQAGPEPLNIAGEAAYRASKWQLAADYLTASGGPPDERSDLLFYLSVSLHELGDLTGARQSLLRALPGLEKTPLVERYQREILAARQ